MARPIIVSTNVVDKLSDVVAYLKDDLKLSQEAALKYRDRFLDFIRTFCVEVNHPLCRSKNGVNAVIGVPYLKNNG